MDIWEKLLNKVNLPSNITINIFKYLLLSLDLAKCVNKNDFEFSQPAQDQ